MDRDTFEKKVDFKTQMYKKKVGFNTYLKRPTHEPGISCQQAILQVAKKPVDGMESITVHSSIECIVYYAKYIVH